MATVSATNIKSLKEALKDVPAERLGRKCSDEDLNEISRALTRWSEVLPSLGLTEADEVAIRDQQGLKKARIDVLRRWKEKQKDKATYRSLIEAFHRSQQPDLVDVVIRLLHRPASSPLSSDSSNPKSRELTISDLPRLMRILGNSASDARQLGIQLCIDPNLLNTLERQASYRPVNYLSLVLETRLRNATPPLTLHDLTEAIHHPPINKPTLAQQLQDHIMSLAQTFYLVQRIDMIDTTTDVLERAPTISQATPPPPQTPPIPSPPRAPLTPPPQAPPTPPPQAPPIQQRSPVAEYGEYLKERYKEDLPIFSLQWPPLPVRKAFKLALIKPTKVRRGEIDDEYVRMTITGKVDDILHMKTPVKLESIFQLEQNDQQHHGGDENERKRRVVLVEGAPGSGKSTMAWDSCRRWVKGELFQVFDVVILVQLRDPEVQAAKTLADVLPADGDAMAERVASQILAQNGESVLFLLDGWDELPQALQKKSLYQSLLNPHKKSELHRHSVLVTSRPISSGKLHPLVSSRIEIVGFTPEERKHYFTECLHDNPGAVETLLERVEENPVVASSCYLPLNAAIIAHLFLSGNHTLPTTVHGIFTSLVLCCLCRNQIERRGLEGQAADIESLDSLPKDLQKPFRSLCILAYSGVMKDSVTFSAADLKGQGCANDVSALGLLQAVTSMLSHKTEVYYNFLHLQIQELLAAYYISSLPASEQISHFRKLFNQSRLASVLQFYAGITRFQSAGIRDVITTMIRGGEKRLLVSVIGCLFEADDPSLCHFVAEQLNGCLTLGYCRLTLSPLDCLAIGYFLSCVSTSINGVGLKGCFIDDYCCKFLMRRLSRCPTLSTSGTGQLTLNLSENGIHEEGAHHIAQVLRNSGVVQRLNLSNNPIGEAGLKFLAEALITNSSVVNLNIRKCSLKVTDENGPVLQEMLQKNRALRELEMGDNTEVSDNGAVYITEGLKHNSTLRALWLSNCGIGSTGVKSIYGALAVNQSLKQLGLVGNNSISVRGVSMILTESLKTNRGLTLLCVPEKFRSLHIEQTINAVRRARNHPELTIDYTVVSKLETLQF